ncbi:MAG: hypothetical protein M1835_006134 [Candelina submexicana]|nr:MAG: hypothetical protein M1835_006134 [Candelina submexicana]
MTEATQRSATLGANESSDDLAPRVMDQNDNSNGQDSTVVQSPPAIVAASSGGTSRSPKKRRKVNHGLVFTVGDRCIKRNIGHLCHDELRDPVKRSKSEHDTSTGEEETSPKHESPPGNGMTTSFEPGTEQQTIQDADLSLDPPPVPQVGPADTAQILPPSPVSGSQTQALNSSTQQSLVLGYDGYNDWSLGLQNQFHDMHTFHPSYMFNAPEVTNEYNLLNDFLSNSLLDDGALYAGDELQTMYPDSTNVNAMRPSTSNLTSQYGPGHQQSQPPSSQAVNAQGNSISRPASAMPIDKAKETYYMTAADPAGTEPPEERMNKLLQAKYDAGMLKPFNYVKGYARLNQYMDQHMQSSSRQKILRQLDKFRPKFREHMHSLSDIELVLVEMWFERSLMEYDRVFASMAIPACCWRRTGEIFRGNKEMAELIHVPIEQLRDGKLAIHEIIVEDQLVSYWEKFGAIAFDSSQKAMLTSCSLKNPDSKVQDSEIHCCFSFTIRRDNHNIPSLIVGNFLPIDPPKK